MAAVMHRNGGIPIIRFCFHGNHALLWGTSEGGGKVTVGRVVKHGGHSESNKRKR